MDQLVRDIERGQIDVVVLYKIDRLTRSLRDFMRLIETFERYGVAFVSITQSFDTDDSLGRLVLNILLTFAQFEREMHADRIRDKQLAMRRRGLWTGGVPPYGYNLEHGRLVINEAEAAVVKRIFERFIATRSYGAVRRELEADDTRSKTFVTKAGRVFGNSSIAHATIHHIIKNPFCVGDVPTAEGQEPGQHQPIIDRETWNLAQKVRAARSSFKLHVGASPNVLLGFIFDALGRPMTIHDGKVKQTRYRYYHSSTPKWARQPHTRRIRVNADRLEAVVKSALADILCDRERLRTMLIEGGLHGAELDSLTARGSSAIDAFMRSDNERTALALRALLARVEIARDRVRLVLRSRQVERLLRHRGKARFRQNQRFGEAPEPTLLLNIPLSVIRCQRQFVLPTNHENRPKKANRHLLKLLDEAREAKRLVEEERLPIIEVAQRLHERSGSIAGRILRLNYLAPDIIASILDGTQPPELSRKQLVRADLPLDWALQRRMFGFVAQAPMQMGEERY